MWSKKRQAEWQASRPPFHVSMKSVGIPEPPKVFTRPWLTLAPKINRAITPWWQDNSTKKLNKQLREDHGRLKEELYKVKQEKAALTALNNSHATRIDKIREETEKFQLQARSYKKQMIPFQKFQNDIHEKNQQIANFATEMADKPHEIREENREMRKALVGMESLLQAKKDELRKLKIKDGVGEYVRAFLSLQKEHENIDVKIATLKSEREELQQSVYTISTGLASNITGLMQTNRVAFRNVDLSLYEGNCISEAEDENANTLAMAIEKGRARQRCREKVEERAADIESQLQILGRGPPAVKIRPPTRKSQIKSSLKPSSKRSVKRKKKEMPQIAAAAVEKVNAKSLADYSDIKDSTKSDNMDKICDLEEDKMTSSPPVHPVFTKIFAVPAQDRPRFPKNPYLSANYLMFDKIPSRNRSMHNV